MITSITSSFELNDDPIIPPPFETFVQSTPPLSPAQDLQTSMRFFIEFTPITSPSHNINPTGSYFSSLIGITQTVSLGRQIDFRPQLFTVIPYFDHYATNLQFPKTLQLFKNPSSDGNNLCELNQINPLIYDLVCNDLQILTQDRMVLNFFYNHLHHYINPKMFQLRPY